MDGKSAEAPVLLALSTFRKSEAAVKRAIEAARGAGVGLLVAVVVDQNLARYLIDTDLLPGSRLRALCEADLLQQHRRENEEAAGAIAAAAARQGVRAEVLVTIGRFAIEAMKVIDVRRPQLVVTTRSNRPDWVRRFFGSPVDEVVSHAPCPVEVI